MMYFYKKSESGRAIICTTAKMGTKKVKLPNGVEITTRVQMADLKFGVIAIGDQDIGELEVGAKLPFKIVGDPIIDDDGKVTTLYWCTPE